MREPRGPLIEAELGSALPGSITKLKKLGSFIHCLAPSISLKKWKNTKVGLINVIPLIISKEWYRLSKEFASRS